MGTLRRWSGTHWDAIRRHDGTAWRKTYAWDGAWKPPAGLPKIATLTDDFATSLDKVTKWPASNAATVWDASGRAKIPCTNAYPNLATSGAGTYDLTGSSVYAKITPPVVGAGSRETFLQVLRGGGNTDRVTIYASGTSISARAVVNNVTVGQAPDVTYNATAHAWWRIRESGGSIYFDGSPDGTTWTNLWSTAIPFPITQVWLNFVSGYWGTESAADTFVDNVNTPPSASPTVVGHTKGADQTTSALLTPALPSGLVAGDLLLLGMFSTDTSVGVTVTPTVPAGWTVRHALANVGSMQRAYYSAVYTAGLVMPSWALSAARRNGYVCTVVRPAAGGGVYGLTDLAASSADTVAPSVTAAGAGIVVRTYLKKDTTSTSVSVPAGHTLIGQVLTTAGPAPHVMACSAPVAAAGATGTATATWSAASANGSSWSVAIS